MNARDAKAITTSLTRAEGLAAEGYHFRVVRGTVPPDGRVGRCIVEVKGCPTLHRRRDGSTRIEEHGPYTVDTRAETCTCPSFAHRGVCPHILPAQDFERAWEAGESMPVVASPREELIALREVKGERLVCRDRRVVVFRSWQRAARYWEEAGHVAVCELAPIDAKDLQATGRYVGLLLISERRETPIDFGMRPHLGVQPSSAQSQGARV